MYRFRYLIAVAAWMAAQAGAQAPGAKPPSERVQELFQEMHVTLSCVQLELTEEQANLIIEKAPGVRAKREALEMRHEESLQAVLPELTRAVEMMRLGQIQQASQLADQVRGRIERIEEDLRAGLAGVADGLRPVYLKLTQKQRVEVFDEFFPQSGSERALDSFMKTPPEQREQVKADFAIFVIEQSTAYTPEGKPQTADPQKVLAVFDKVAPLSDEQYQAQRQNLVNELVGLLPKNDGIQPSALQAFVEFMSTPNLEVIVQRVQRMR